jgi:hypothetical protein
MALRLPSVIRVHPWASALGALAFVGGALSLKDLSDSGKASGSAGLLMTIVELLLIVLGAPGEVVAVVLVVLVSRARDSIRAPAWVLDAVGVSQLVGIGVSLLVGALVNVLVFAAAAGLFDKRSASPGARAKD